MSDAELLSRWYLVLTIAALLVVVVAALLIAILMTARRIERAATRAHAAVRKIADHTAAIWAIEATNAGALRIRETVRSIREHAEEIAKGLQAPAGPRA